jgi:hypothetical protein
LAPARLPVPQRQQEVNAMIDYNRSIVAFETIQTAPAR